MKKIEERIQWSDSKDGETIKVDGRIQYIECCDCGLVHKLQFKIIKGKRLTFKAYRDNKRTIYARKRSYAI